jgi:hypothetical protein
MKVDETHACTWAGATLWDMTVAHDDPTATLLEELDVLAAESSQDAIRELLQQGISIFYLENAQDVREDPDGSRFAIEYVPGVSGEYRILKPLPVRE